MIYPAIDLMDGGCVRLFKGDFECRTNYDASPLAMAQSFAADGAHWVHIVDLDGAKNERAAQSDIIINIAQKVGIKVQTGGGIRDTDQIERLLEGGIARIVIGSLAVSDVKQVKSWMKNFGAEKFCLALDVQIDEAGVPRPALRGWADASPLSLWDVLAQYNDVRLGALLVTDIAKDGVLAGPNLELYRNILARYPDINLITSGGVGTLADVKALKSLQPFGIIIGKAIYENKLTLKDAIAC